MKNNRDILFLFFAFSISLYGCKKPEEETGKPQFPYGKYRTDQITQHDEFKMYTAAGEVTDKAVKDSFRQRFSQYFVSTFETVTDSSIELTINSDSSVLIKYYGKKEQNAELLRAPSVGSGLHLLFSDSLEVDLSLGYDRSAFLYTWIHPEGRISFPYFPSIETTDLTPRTYKPFRFLPIRNGELYQPLLSVVIATNWKSSSVLENSLFGGYRIIKKHNLPATVGGQVFKYLSENDTLAYQESRIKFIKLNAVTD
jgi:hypothetical protein